MFKTLVNGVMVCVCVGVCAGVGVGCPFLSYAIDNDFVLGLLLVVVVGGWVSADALNFTSLSLGATQRKS